MFFGENRAFLRALALGRENFLAFAGAFVAVAAVAI